jgi:hypothetical protein
VVQEMAEKATQELAAMEKRAVMAESMLEATINSEACTGNAYVARRGVDLLKGNVTRGIARSHSSPASKQDLDMGWARRSTPGKVEGAGGVAGDVSDDSSAGMHIQSFFGRPFSLSWGEKSKVWCDIFYSQCSKVWGCFQLHFAVNVDKYLP